MATFNVLSHVSLKKLRLINNVVISEIIALISSKVTLVFSSSVTIFNSVIKSDNNFSRVNLLSTIVVVSIFVSLVANKSNNASP